MSIERANEEKEKGNDAFKRGDWAEAVGFYSAAMLSDSKNATFPLNRAMAWLKLNRYIDAEQDCDLALKLTPSQNQSATIKALYRRATAKSSNTKLKSALQDLETILELDPKHPDAKREAESIRKRLKGEKIPSRPLDLLNSSTPKPSRKTDEESSSSASGSVEAARAFLAKVGMGDPLESESKTKEKSSSKKSTETKKPSTKELLPGEEGGFLRQVKTRRLNKDDKESKPTNALKQDSQIESQKIQEKESSSSNQNEASSSKPKSDFDVQSIEDFFLKPKKASKPLEITTKSSSTEVKSEKRKISAFEFDRKWREVSHEKSEETFKNQIDFLGTVDYNFLSKSLGPLLEPDLLSSIIQCLNSSLKSLSQSDTSSISNQTDLSSSSSNLNKSYSETARSLLENLPQCERFSMTMCFLEEREKQEIEEIFGLLKNSGNSLELKEIEKKWV